MTTLGTQMRQSIRSTGFADVADDIASDANIGRVTDSKNISVGVIGLGIMGGTFACHLAAAGVRTLGYDPIRSRIEALEAAGGQGRNSARAVASETDFLITSLPHTEALEETVNELESAGHSGLLVVETSTLPLEAKEAARVRLARIGIALLDAPISGTGPQAHAKEITIFVSGARADFENAGPVLARIARSVRYVGAFGQGSKLKYIANLLVAIHILATAEALVLGEKAGFDAAELVDLLAASAATSRMLEVRGPAMASGAYSEPMMKVGVFQKDLTIIADFAAQHGAPVPLFRASIPFFAEAAAQGFGGSDTAAVIAILRQSAP